MTTEKTEQPRPTILLMFVSRCVLDDGKEGRIYYRITDEQLEDSDLGDDAPMQFTLGGRSSSKYMGGAAGIVYRVEQPPDNPDQIYTATARYEGTWPDREQRAAWQVTDQTKGQEIALKKEAKKAKRDDAVLECLAPIREAYQRARGMQRNLLLARAVQYITRG